MRFSEAKKSRAPVINITSLIDVMFLLVIFVLVSAKFEPESGIAVDLPKSAVSKTEAPTPKKKIYTLVIMHDGTLFLDKKKLLLVDLPPAIQAKRKTLAEDAVLVIRADKTLDLQSFTLVVETVKAAGQSRIDIKTKP